MHKNKKERLDILDCVFLVFTTTEYPEGPSYAIYYCSLYQLLIRLSIIFFRIIQYNI